MLLLCTDFQPGHGHVVQESLLAETDEEIIHGWGLALIELPEDHLHPELSPVLLLLYDLDPCGLCRGDIIQLLHRINALPERMIEECRYDSDEATRAFVASLVN